MSESLARIKSMAGGMSTELDRQNQTIDRLNDKSRLTNERVSDQTNQMKRLKWKIKNTFYYYILFS